MQEIKKRRIVLASVLKPANEPRMFDKIGTSLAKDYDVYCIGGPTAGEFSGATNPKLITLKGTRRISLGRFLAPFEVLKNILRIKPSLLIVGTHELLFIAFLARLFTRCKVVYDVQENYYRNISFGTSFPVILSPFIATYVRAKEWLSRFFVSHYFLAEVGYEKEMRFFGTNRTVLENKLADKDVKRSPKMPKSDGNIHLLFSGTLAETTGVFIAIDLATNLYELDHKIRLKIIGSSASRDTLELITDKIRDRSFIQLIAGSDFISHEKITDAIRTSDFGIISYPFNPSTFNTIPTKLYEYLGLHLPILLVAHPEWSKKCEPYNAAISFNFASPAYEQMLDAMKTREFYTIPPQDVYWLSEEKKLLQTMESLRI